jgi:hypothetical protein
MKTDTGKETDTSTGKKSTGIQTLASESGREGKPLRPVQTKPVSNSSLETLAELLSLIQEDCRRYSETLAEFLPNQKPVTMYFKGDGIIHLCAPPEHVLDTGNGHILLDGRPVTGWTLAEEI